MLRKNGYIRGNLWDYLYHGNYHKLLAKDFSQVINTTIPQEVNFPGKLEEYKMQQCFQ